MTLSSRRFRAGAQRSPAAFAGLVALAVLAGCGSSAASSGSTTTATTSAADGNHTVLSARDKELARHSLIRLSDFPAGWTEQGRITEGNSSSGLPNAQAAHLTSCLRVPVSDIDTRVPRWTSPTFSDDSDAARVDDDVTVYSNAAKAAADYSTFSDPRTPNCVVNVLGGPLKQQIAQQLQSGQSIGQVGAGHRPFPSYGDRSGDIQLVVPITKGVQRVSVYVDVIVVLEGRAVSTLTASSPGIPLASTVGAQLAQAAAVRMRSVT